MKMIFDIETDDLHATKVWCIVVKEIEGDFYKFGPDELDDATMATNFSRALTVNMLTEQVFNLKDKKIILVTAAAGGVGRLLCQYLNSIGKIVIGTVGSQEKIELAK